jgi:hypothetical protein
MIDSLVLGIGGGILFFMAPAAVRTVGQLILGVAYFTVLPVLWRGSPSRARTASRSAT